MAGGGQQADPDALQMPVKGCQLPMLMMHDYGLTSANSKEVQSQQHLPEPELPQGGCSKS